MRVFFTGGGTGGHLYPALAIARALVGVRPDVSPWFIGASRGIEREILPTTEFPHTLLDLLPFQPRKPWHHPATARALVAGWRKVGAVASSDTPALVVGTGGYASSATLAWAAWRGVPYVVHEANAVPGRTVRVFSRWATEVHVGFAEAVAALPPRIRGRCIDTGNPIAPPPVPRPLRADARKAWGLPADVRLVVLVFGGSQGSSALNQVIASWLQGGVPEDVGVIWGTGKAHYDQYASLEGPHVRVRSYLAPIADAYAAADVAVTRAGAMTTAELCAWGIPMCLVPLPTAAADHQTVNAAALARAGAATLMPQAEATALRIRGYVEDMRDDARRAVAADAAFRRARPDAAAVIAARLSALLPSVPVSSIP